MLGETTVTSSILGSGGMSYSPFMTIGEGGMAQVHLAKASGPSGFEKLVVLKTIRRNALSNPRIRELFVDEARLCAQLNHPNLVQVHDVDLETEPPCLVMEYLEGKTLHEVLLTSALTRNMLLAVISEILAGLHYAHELRGFDGRLMGIVHRDMSPHNVLLTYDGTAKVLDFGIAKMAGATSDTATGDVRGKLSYIAPEQLLGGGVDRRADIFAVGVMLWECSVGRPMWGSVPEPAIMHRLANGDIPEVPIQAELTQPLIDLIRKATAANPADRYQTAREFRTALDAYLAASGRRPPMRQVGQALADAFAEERAQNKERIRRALLDLTPTPPPHPVPGPTQALTLDEFAVTNDEEDASRRGAYVLAGAVLLTVLAVAWVLSAPLRGAFKAADGGADASQESRHSTPSDASRGAEGVERTHAGDASLSDKDAQREDPITEPGEVVPDTRDTSSAAPARKQAAPKQAAPKQAAPKQAPRRPSQAASTSAPKTSPASRPAPAGAPTTASNCETPFFYQNGIKVYRPECL